jgi:hypothetical protein
MTEPVFEVAASWSLRNHYTRDLAPIEYGIGKIGRSICMGLPVWDRTYLQGIGFSSEKLDRPRPMCKLCERKANSRSSAVLR